MTDPRPWPNSAKEDRDRAAEEIAASNRELRPLIDEPAPKDLNLRVARAIVHNQEALRHLEAAGAPTRPA